MDRAHEGSRSQRNSLLRPGPERFPDSRHISCLCRNSSQGCLLGNVRVGSEHTMLCCEPNTLRLNIYSASCDGFRHFVVPKNRLFSASKRGSYGTALELDGAMLPLHIAIVKLKLSINDIQSSNRNLQTRLIDLRKPGFHGVRKHDRIRNLTHRFAAFLALPLQHRVCRLFGDPKFLLQDPLCAFHQLAGF